MKAIIQRKIFATSLRFDVSNRVTITTKKTRPVFVDRENPDTPPVITASVAELASLIRNTNSLITRYTIPGLDESYTHAYLLAKAICNEDKPFSDTKTPRSNHPAYKMHFLTAYGNIQPEGKPAFRHDYMFLFDTLSEDYNA